MSTSLPLIILTAGGTGGHVFPAEALAAELLKRGYRLALITDNRGSAYSGTLGALDTHRVAAAQMLGRGLLGKIKGALVLLRGTMQARGLLRQLAPAAVVGFGGYASVPAVAAAGQLGIPTLVHEQNAVLGRANRLFSERVSRIATSFAQVERLPEVTTSRPQLVVQTGMPVRETIRQVVDSPYPLDQGDSATCPLPIVVLGGSQGARVLSDVLPAALSALPEGLKSRIQLSQQARPEDVERVQQAYQGQGLGAVTVKSFFDDVPQRLAQAVLVIGRSGSSTVAECAATGRPALYIPLPSAADDHQTANARAVEAAGGAWVLPQSGFTTEAVCEQIAALLNAPQTLCAAAQAARAFSIPDAASRLADAVVDLIAQETRP
jgi:UDP-N-acetylglucosamine--N-acetylmuramyl-(pentapeptide) pyrophosphoryl-undecaprenol N-acetylglucosamine transferase